MQPKEFKERFDKMRFNLETSYNIIVCYHLNEHKQIMLSDGDKPQKCRFCGREFPDVTFKKNSTRNFPYGRKSSPQI